ncbi:MAG TPA: hypothetical protein VHL34_02490 [Rhizomicrobium sp.]|jgi:hypothetical protein|nr:hypothetical protein [Rhizomicrobium sp.]
MTAADILAWHDFFAAVAGAGATLAGLLFVGLTISLDNIVKARGYLSRAFTALFLQFEILLVGLVALVPGQPGWVLGIEWIIAGVGVLTGITVFRRNFPEDENSMVLSSRFPRIVRFTLTNTGTLLPAIAGVALFFDFKEALYLVIPAIAACIYLSIGYAWVFAVEIPRRSAGS